VCLAQNKDENFQQNLIFFFEEILIAFQLGLGTKIEMTFSNYITLNG